MQSAPTVIPLKLDQLLELLHFDIQGWAPECPNVRNYKW